MVVHVITDTHVKNGRLRVGLRLSNGGRKETTTLEARVGGPSVCLGGPAPSADCDSKTCGTALHALSRIAVYCKEQRVCKYSPFLWWYLEKVLIERPSLEKRVVLLPRYRPKLDRVCALPFLDLRNVLQMFSRRVSGPLQHLAVAGRQEQIRGENFRDATQLYVTCKDAYHVVVAGQKDESLMSHDITGAHAPP